jgi:hypothetical protein
VTDQRVLFYPHKFDSATDGEAWQRDLESITRVSIAPRGRNLFDGSIRRRLRIDGETTEYFVVNRVHALVDAISSAAGL